jgi:pimeloyl-ACP methyl ester carboxylesterase
MIIEFMISVTASLTWVPPGHPPIVLIHGAANSASIWTYWQASLAEFGWSSYAIDLRGHGRSAVIDLSNTSMADYAADVRLLIQQLAVEPVIVGWSLGGLVALMLASEGGVRASVALAPSAPALRHDATVQVRRGVFGPEEYGLTDQSKIDRAMPDLIDEERAVALGSLGGDSRYARDERRAGIVIDRVQCPLLIVTGTADREWPLDRYRDLRLPATYLSAGGASHWGLVLNRRALATLIPQVLDWLTVQTS